MGVRSQRLIFCWGALLGLLAGGGSDTWATIKYVDNSALGKNDCSSWIDACNDLQEALNLAVIGDEIWVAAGTYKPDLPNGSRFSTFQLKNGVAIYGGFAGTEMQVWQRNSMINITVLTGDLQGNDSGVWPNIINTDENSFHVVSGSETDATAIIDGFTVQAGNADDSNYPNNTGGGMLIDNGDVTVRQCLFFRNRAIGGGGMAVDGGAPKIQRCIFYQNSAITLGIDTASGGGILSGGQPGASVDNCRIIGNRSDHNGGGMTISASNPTVINTIFSSNEAFDGNGGGLIIGDQSAPNLTNCTFAGNNLVAGTAGGGIYTTGSNPTFRNCIIWNNRVGGNSDDECDQICKSIGSPGAPNVCKTDIQYLSMFLGCDNIPDDPQFIDPDGLDRVIGTLDDNLRLIAGSPCIDIGDNSAVTVLDDLDGNKRIHNGTVDLGAYEFGASAVPAIRTFGFLVTAMLLVASRMIVVARRHATR